MSSGSTATFPQLLTAACAGDARALGELFSMVRPELIRTADASLNNMLRPKGSGADLAQDTILQAIRMLDRFQGQTDSEFRAWLIGILHNRIRTFERRYLGTKKRNAQREYSLDQVTQRDHLSLIDVEKSPSSIVRQNEDDRRLLAALTELPEADREIIYLRNFEKLSFALIGKRQGKNEDTVRMQWARAIDKLRRVLETDSGTPPATTG